MTETLPAIEERTALDAMKVACRRIAPVWPLQDFVAVNPFLGLAEMPFREAAQLMERIVPGGMLMDSGGARHLLTVAEWLDRTQGTRWDAFVVDEISKWCSSYFDRGQSSWKMPWADLSLWDAWKQAARIDANPEAFGLAGFRQRVRELPDSPQAAIEEMVGLLGVSQPVLVDFLHRELMSVSGWSAYAAYHDWRAEEPTVLPQLLAIRLAYDVALFALDKSWRCGAVSEIGDCEEKCDGQDAREEAFRDRLLPKLRALPEMKPRRAELQAIFCIDVRSEVYRRALEAQSESIETIGFAGFFGMPVAVSDSARCPVLLEPKYQVGETNAAAKPSRFAKIWKSLTQSATACFPAVEVAGAWFGVKMVEQSFKRAVKRAGESQLAWEIALGERIDLAAGALKNMSLDVALLAPVVLVCGHGSETENNPYAASLDCGACGGHKGDVNARFAAALLNDPEVRQGLQARGLAIPADTVFVAGLHITTTDEVILFERRLLSEQTRRQVEGWLKSASDLARRERNGQPEKEVLRRSVDWSEIRPEWGLAGNAAFIAAPRWRTRGVNLEGRVFLHDYEPDRDSDASVLTLILTAPVIVASWINLQYFGSTVNNAVFGSGNKVLHNVVGGFGVWEGNGGDLRTGLPLQSLHDGKKWMHEALRLQVVVEAPCERIDSVLENNRQIANLVENEWLHLLAIDCSAIYRCSRVGQWNQVGALV